MIFKKLLFLTFFLSCFIFFKSEVFGSEEFFVDTDVEYIFDKKGGTHVTYDISIENRFTTLSPKIYTLTFTELETENVSARMNEKLLLPRKIDDYEETVFEIELEDSSLGKGSKTNFTVSFDTNSLTTHTGEVWEISLPKLEDGSVYRNYSVTLVVPDSYGDRAYVTPLPASSQTLGSTQIFSFNKETISKNPIVAGFGNFQVFNFTLKYHLQNPLLKPSQTEIPIPPSTNLQKVYIQSMNPAPEDVFEDADGNWLAVYNLAPRQRADVEVVGTVQLFAKTTKLKTFKNDYLTKNLLPQKYWETDDPIIINVAKNLKTPRQVYDYVVSELNYNLERVKPNVERLGAVGVIENKSSAICMEFTDLFVTLARASGIPAREVNGYAYSENPDIEPLSLVVDVLHSWPEYWNPASSEWVMVDPTWANTTNGLDFFGRNDLRHFAFVFHGISSEKPYPPGSYKLGNNPEKDVFINFGKLPEMRKANLEIETKNKSNFIFFNKTLEIKITNTGTTAAHNLTPQITFGNEKIKKDKIQVLPPYAKETITAQVPYNFLGIKNPEEIIISVGDAEKSLPSQKEPYILVSLTIFLFFSTIFVVFFLAKNKKEFILKILSNINPKK